MLKKTVKIKTLGSIESLTGGLFASSIVSIPGASKYFKGALVTYSKEIKNKFGINTINGTVNAQVAKDMAFCGQKLLNVDICVAFTGNAGPDVEDNQPIGKVFIAIKNQNQIDIYEKILLGSRQEIRMKCVNFAFKKLQTFYPWLKKIS